jgi:hypothetical protein
MGCGIRYATSILASDLGELNTLALSFAACLIVIVNGGLNAQKPEADIWRIMPPYFDQEKGGDLAPF